MAKDKRLLPMGARPAFLHSIEYAVTTWYFSVRPEVIPDDLLDPKFWALVARNMKANQRVVVDCEDRSWSAELFVLEATMTGARVALTNLIDLDKAKRSPAMGPGDGETYEMNWLSPTAKYQVVRKSDGAEMERGLEKAKAMEWIRDRARIEAA